MTIWKTPFTLEGINSFKNETMVSHLGIEFIEVGDSFLKARMPVLPRIKQPFGLMHGGASCVLAETVGSIAGHFCLDINRFYCVGIEINTSHIRAVKEGWVVATAKPLHLGTTSQVWEIPIYNEEEKLISMNRLRLAVLELKSYSDI